MGLSASTPDTATASPTRPLRQRLLKCLLRLAHVSGAAESGATRGEHTSGPAVPSALADALVEVRRTAASTIALGLEIFFPTAADRLGIVAQLLRALHPESAVDVQDDAEGGADGADGTDDGAGGDAEGSASADGGGAATASPAAAAGAAGTAGGKVTGATAVPTPDAADGAYVTLPPTAAQA